MLIRNDVQETAGAHNDYHIYIFTELLIIIFILTEPENTEVDFSLFIWITERQLFNYWEIIYVYFEFHVCHNLSAKRKLVECQKLPDVNHVFLEVKFDKHLEYNCCF